MSEDDIQQKVNDLCQQFEKVYADLKPLLKRKEELTEALRTIMEAVGQTEMKSGNVSATLKPVHSEKYPKKKVEEVLGPLLAPELLESVKSVSDTERFKVTVS